MEQNDFRLVARDVPVILWIFGLVFGGVGAVWMYAEGLRMPIVGYIFLAAGLCFLLPASVLKITADRRTRTLTLERRSLLSHSRKEISFEEIEAIGVQCTSGSKGPSYRAVLKRKDESVVPFRGYYSGAFVRLTRQTAAIREFIGVASSDVTPAQMPAPALQPYVDQAQATNGVQWRLKQPRHSGLRWHSPDFKTQGVFVCAIQKVNSHSSLGGFGVKQALMARGFDPADTPGLEGLEMVWPLNPLLDTCFVVCANDAATARRVLNPEAVQALAAWAGRRPLKMFNPPSSMGQLIALFSPSGVYLAPWNLSKAEQVGELAALGSELVKAQSSN